MNNWLKLSHNSYCILIFIFFFVSYATVQGQKVTVSGTVFDEASAALPGVSVVEEGTTNGVSTDFDGNYTISVQTGSTLLFSYIGFVQQRITINSERMDLDINLEPDVSNLDEVVVVGYGVTKKESLVGAVSQLDGEALTQRGVLPNVTDALSGAIPGVTVLSSTGIPGGAPNDDFGQNSSILIRGVSTFNNAAPLVLVDNVERDFNDIDPNDIESISILKDAAETAVFGVKGGNGVILITTKRGRTGEPVFKVDGNYAVKSISRIPKTLDSYTGLLARNRAIVSELGTNPTSWDSYTSNEILDLYQSQEFPDAFPNVDWQDVMLNDTAASYKLNLSVSGGTEFMQYYGSLGYLNDGDIFATEDLGQGYDPDFKYERFNYRANLDFNLTKSTKLSVNLGGQYGSQQLSGASQFQFWFGVYSKPWNTPVVQYEDGIYGQGIDFERLGSNEFVELNFNGTTVNNRYELTTLVTLDQKLDFITKGLTFKGEFSYDTYGLSSGRGIDDDGVLTKYVNPDYYLSDNPDVDINDFTDFFFPNTDSDGFEFTDNPLNFQNEVINGNAANGTRINILGRFSLRYNRTFGKHSINGLALFSRESQKNYRVNGFPLKREDYTGRLVYTYDNRYTAQFAGAYNGSDAFGPEFRRDFFPSLGFTWVASNEKWFDVAKPYISNLKFRFTDGEVGNDRSGIDVLFPYLTQFSTGSVNGNGINDNVGFGTINPINGPLVIREAVIGNPNLRWETGRQRNYGVDLGFFDDKLTMSMDLFEERRKDIIIPSEDRQVPDLFGAPAPAANLGIVENQGYEFTASYRNSVGDFYYSGTFVHTHVEDEVIFREDPELTPAYQQQAGFQIGQNRGILEDGIVQSWDEIYTGVVDRNTGTFLPGDFRLVDFNADGVIDQNDGVAFGYPNRPRNTYNFIFDARWKGFNLNLNFFGQYNVTQTINPGEFNFSAPSIYQRLLDNTWTPEYGNANPAFRGLRFNRPNVSNGNFYNQDASFLRLKTAEFGYSFPKGMIERFGLNNLRFFVNGNNLWLWSDLQVDIEGTNFNVRNYPVTKQVNFGFTASF